MPILANILISLAAGCVVSLDIHGAHARPLASVPRGFTQDDLLHILELRNGSTSLSSAVDTSDIRRRDARPILMPLVSDENDALQFIPVRIGSNPNPFRIVADTGSSDFWVYSSTCPTRGNKNSVNTPILPGSKASFIAYENGVAVTTEITRDVVDFGGRALNMPFAAATEASALIADKPEEGVMGFALASGARMGLPPVLDTLFLSGLIQEPVTGWKIARHKDGKNDGEVVLGGVNPTKFVAQSLVTVKNLDAVSWKAKVDGASIGNIRVMTSPRTAILDTGALHITTSFQDAALLHAYIFGTIVTPAHQYLLPCNNQVVLSLSIGGVFWTIDPRDLVNAPLPPEAGMPGYCFSSIQPTAARQPGEWLVGTTFLKNVYTVLDSKANTIGIAALR